MRLLEKFLIQREASLDEDIMISNRSKIKCYIHFVGHIHFNVGYQAIKLIVAGK